MRTIGSGFQVGVFLALVALTTATFLLSFAPLGAAHVPVALAIAAAKAALIVFFFMHLAEQERVNGLYLMAALLLLAVFVGLVVADVETRVPGARPAAAPEAAPPVRVEGPPPLS
ncbi:MAG: cytochrome C oxidase subunit IV family protein [Myxococcota bacterium]